MPSSPDHQTNRGFEQRALRDILGRFATGVTVMTTRAAGGEPVGMTVNSFTSVSLEPPLILWNIAKSSNSLDAYLQAKDFAIHILNADQLALSIQFARSDHTMFNGVSYERSAANVPILPNCAAVFECSTHKIHDSGDHYIIVGRVDRFTWEKSEPLLFFRGRYRKLGDKID